MNDNPSPQNQLIYVPYVPPALTDQIIAIGSENRHLAVENEKLKNERIRSQQREQAYSKILDLGGDRTYVLGRNGVPQELMDCKVSSATFFDPQPPLRDDPFYEIKMAGHEVFRISKKDFDNTTSLINTFQQHGIRVSRLKTDRTTAALIRQAVNEHIQRYSLNGHAGWWLNEKGLFTYWFFSPFSTHHPLGSDSFDSLMMPLPPSRTPAFAAIAAQQFLPVFDLIRNAFLRQTVLLLYHAAALHSLLRKIDHLPPLSFCLFATDENILSYLEELLSWFSDPPLTLDMPSQIFGDKMLFRNDQPLLIEDHGRLDYVKENISILESALVNKTVSWKDKRSTQSLDLQAPITLLSSRPSRLSIAPEVIVLDFSTEDFDPSAWLEIAGRISQNQDYLTAFCGYTMEHIADLKSALSEGENAALHFADSQLTRDCRKMLGIFIGLQNFLNGFFAFSSVENSPISLSPEDFLTQFAELLAQTSEKSYLASLPEQFLEVARQYIRSGHFHIYEREKCPQDVNGAVLFDDKYIYFTSQAFFEVCYSMAQSRPVILAALAEADLFRGAQTNATTAQTRITVWHECGISRSVSVYKFDRDAFDDLINSLFGGRRVVQKTGFEFHLGHTSAGKEVVWHNADNLHISITGQSGTGKSYFLKKLIAQAVSQGAVCLVPDYSSDFCDYIPPEGQRFQHIDVTSPNDFALNPLIGSPGQSPAACAQQLVASLHSVFRTGPRAAVALEKATEEYLTVDNAPTLPGLLAYISEKERPEMSLLHAIEPLELLSSLIRCGDEPITVDLDSPGLVVLDLTSIFDQKICSSLVNLILQTLWITHSREQPPLILVLDEARRLNWGDGSLATRILYEGRKFGIAGWFSSQRVSRKEAEEALEQAKLHVHFHPGEQNANKLAKTLGCTSSKDLPQYRKLILGLECGQFLWLNPDGKPVLVEVEP